jgi:hypothetical protein
MAITAKQKRRMWWLTGTLVLLIVLTPVLLMAAFVAVRHHDAVTIARGCGPWSKIEVQAIITENLMRKAQRRPWEWPGFTGPVFTGDKTPSWPTVPAKFWYHELLVQRSNQFDEVWRAMVDCTHDVTYSVLSRESDAPISPALAFPPK